MFLEKAIYSSHAKSTTNDQEMTRPAVALIVEAGKLRCPIAFQTLLEKCIF